MGGLLFTELVIRAQDADKFTAVPQNDQHLPLLVVRPSVVRDRRLRV